MSSIKIPGCVFLFFATLSLAGCTQRSPIVSGAEHSPTDSVITIADESGTLTVADSANDGCTGAVPDHPIVDSIAYPNRKFHLEGRVGYNEFVTKEGDSIIIRQSNCDYASYQFTVITTRFNMGTDTSEWVKKAADIIAAAKPSLNLAVQMDSGLYYLRKFYAEKNMPIGKEIHFDDRPEYSWINVVSVEGLEQNEKGCTIRLIFFEGPL